MTQREEKVVVGTVHKWAGTTITVCVLIWGAMAYYVKAEDEHTRMTLQSQIDVLKIQQAQSERVNQLVVGIDKKLSNIETSLTYQSKLMEDVKLLRKEVNELKVELAKKTGD